MWRKVLALSPPQRMLLARAFTALAWERVRLGLRRATLPADCHLARQPDGVDPRAIAWAINVAARAVPGATCLVRALAAQRLLTRHGHASNLHIGVAHAAGAGFEAHAWIESNGSILVGRTEQQYAPLLKRSAA